MASNDHKDATIDSESNLGKMVVNSDRPETIGSHDEAASIHVTRDDLPVESRQRALQEELLSLLDVVGPTPIVDLLLERSFQLGATDIHFDPRKTGLHVRLRLDGVLHDILEVDQGLAPQIISRIKLISGMNITEKRIAQDGHISNSLMAHQRDVRVGSGPTIYGERIVMRLMPDGSRYTDLNQLGLTDNQIDLVSKAIACPYGVVLSVGPVGSGKSTTTYSCLARLNDPGSSLVTIEDPVERRIDNVNQIQVDHKINFGFVEALRGILRQDPDVIMVGEIRDAETAHIAMRAGLTGTRVLSTLHASDTGATLDMFREFQIPRMFLADALNCIIAQRLVRKICTKDRETYKPDSRESAILKLTEAERNSVELVKGIPSDANFHTGYFGRTGIYEVMTFDSDIRDIIFQGKSGRSVYDTAIEKGMQTLEDSVKRKILDGITTVEEMIRVLMH